MSSRTIFVLLAALIFGLFTISCNSGETKKKNNTSDKVSVTDSLPIYEDMLEDDSMNIDLRIYLALKYYKVKRYDNAITHLQKVYKLDNGNLTAIVNLGNLYYDTNKDEEAIKFYKEALLIDSTNTNVRCDMATCYLNLGEPETALELLKKNIKMDYDHAQSHHNISVVYSELGMEKEAKEESEIFSKLTGK